MFLKSCFVLFSFSQMSNCASRLEGGAILPGRGTHPCPHVGWLLSSPCWDWAVEWQACQRGQAGQLAASFHSGVTVPLGLCPVQVLTTPPFCPYCFESQLSFYKFRFLSMKTSVLPFSIFSNFVSWILYSPLSACLGQYVLRSIWINGLMHCFRTGDFSWFLGCNTLFILNQCWSFSATWKHHRVMILGSY